MVSPEEEQIKEAFTWFGAAIFHSNCIERQLAILLSMLDYLESESDKKRDFEDIRGLYFRKTLGQMVKRLSEKTIIPDDLKTKLQEALEKRNWLVHYFFWEHAVPFCSTNGRKRMIVELQILVDVFINLDKQLETISRNIQREYGISDKIIEKEVAELLKTSDGP